MSRILIVRLSAIGDVIQSTPVARQIKKQHPDCRLSWIIQRKALAGIANNPHIDEIICIDGDSPRQWLAAVGQLRARRFDIVVDVQCLLKSALLTRLSGAPVRIGREDAREGSRWAYTQLEPTHMNQVYISQQYLEQCASLGVDIDDYVPELHLSSADTDRAAELWQEAGLTETERVLGLVAFGAEPTREWPLERYALLADRLVEEFAVRSMVFGSRGEIPRAEKLAAAMKNRPVIMTGKTSLGEAAALLQRCRLAVGGDTGLIHYCFALNTPLVCLLGASPLRNGPKSDRAITVHSPCEYRPCRPAQACRRGEGRPCIQEISVEQVIEAARTLLRKDL